MIQTGDVVYHNGYGCISAFDTTSFDDESFELYVEFYIYLYLRLKELTFNFFVFSLHDRPGIVSMANKGPDSM